MKTITILPIKREELSAILMAANMQFKDWASKCDDETVKEYWLTQIRNTLKIRQYMTEYYQEEYYLYEEMFKIH